MIFSSAGLTGNAIPVINYFGAGPEIVNSEITWTSTNASNQGGSVFGFTEGYGFSSNGSSSGVVTGLNDSTSAYGVADTMTFLLTHPVQAIGATINWDPDGGDNVIISAYNSSNVLLDSLSLNGPKGNIVTPNVFYGFEESSSDISSFKLTDGYVATIGDIYTGGNLVSAVPEPATWAMMLFGFGCVGWTMRSKRRQVSARIA